MVENEIQYVPWTQFQQLVPSILGLEISRLTRCIEDYEVPLEQRNELVKARFDLRQFIDCVTSVEMASVNHCASHLNSALLHVLPYGNQSDLSYVIDRLTYVHDRIPFVY